MKEKTEAWLRENRIDLVWIPIIAWFLGVHACVFDWGEPYSSRIYRAVGDFYAYSPPAIDEPNSKMQTHSSPESGSEEKP